MRYFARWAVLLWAVLAGVQIASAAAGKRVALVIGNGSYAHIAHLPNVANDAAAMAALFKGAGFDRVEVRLNAGAAGLRRALKELAGVAADADVAVVFYAGHGIEVGQAQYSEGWLGSAGKTVEVGSFPANRFALHDMHGNVWEWVEDAWHSSYQGAPVDGSAWQGGDALRVLRGGAWVNGPVSLHSANRFWNLPSNRENVFGFRLARTL